MPLPSFISWPFLRRVLPGLAVMVLLASLARGAPPLQQISPTVYRTEHCLFVIDASVTWSSPATAYNDIYAAGSVAPYFPRLNGYFDTLLAQDPGAQFFSVCYMANTGDSHVPNYIDRTFKADGINETYVAGPPYTFATVDLCRYNMSGGGVTAQALGVFDHELGHAWGARAFYNLTPPSLSDGHWLPNSTVDCQMSATYSGDGGVTVNKLHGDPVNGFRWQKVDNARSNEYEVFSEQTLYLLGVRQTWPTAYVLNSPVYQADGTATAASVDTFDHAGMVAAYGPRTPDYTTAQKRFKLGFVYIARDLAEVNAVYQNVEASVDQFCNGEAIDPVAYRAQTPFLCDTRFRASVDGLLADLDGNATPTLAVDPYVASADGTAVVNFTAADADGPAPAVTVVPASACATVSGGTVQLAGLPDGVHFFSLKAQDAAGKRVFAHFTVEVQRPGAAIALTSQPVPQTATAGGPASFSVAATGTPASLTYQWFRQAARSSTWNPVGEGGAYAGSAAATLTVTTGTAMDGDEFLCVVTNAAGTVTSTAARLVVNETLPSLTTQPADANAASGNSVLFSVGAGGAPATFGYFHYQWQHSTDGGANWSDLANGAPYTGCTTAAFRVTASLGLSGHQFRCQVGNTAGTVTSNAATLTVGTVPAVTTQPVSVATSAGQTATFSVVASGSGPLTYEWSIYSTPVPGGTGATLVLTNVQAADVGAYTVFISNAYGSTRSNVGTLTVSAAAPTITTHPQTATVAIGQPASFSVAATGTNPFTYQWKKDNLAISGATGATLAIPSVQPADAASYTVVVTNSAGSATSNAADLVVPTSNGISYGSTTFPALVTAGAAVTFTYDVTNAGTRTWGVDHHLSLRTSNGSYLAFPSLNGTAAGGSKAVGFAFTAPASPGVYTYYVEAQQDGVEVFGLPKTLTLTVPTPVTGSGNAINYGATTFPATAAPGSVVTFTYDVTNTGPQAWGVDHHLSLRTSNGAYLAFPSLNGVAAGGSRTASFAFTAPASPGVYTYFVEALQDGVEVFGLPMTLTLTVPTPVTGSGNGISYGLTTFPAIAAPGAAIYFTYDVTNTGTSAWGTGHHLSLRTSNGSYLAFPSLNGVAPGGSKSAGFTFNAPASPGVYTYYVEALQDGVEVFGLPMTLTLTVPPPVSSSGNAISYGTTTFPASAAPGAAIYFTCNVTNTGTQAWGVDHHLSLRTSNGTYLVFPSLNGVAPGGGKVAGFTFNAPATPGVYTYYVEALQDGMEVFGLPVTLTLTVPAPVSGSGNAINYGLTTFPAIAAPGAAVYFTYSVTNTGTQAWGVDHHLSLRTSNGAYLAFPSLSGVAVDGGKIAGFTFTAPATPGVYTYYVEALQDGVEFFGLPVTLTLTVPPPASGNGNAIGYGTTTFPAIAAAGAPIYFTYNVTNTGTRAWNANHHLSLRTSTGTYLTFPSLDGVAAGGGKIAGFTFTAPVTPGVYPYYVEALEDGVEVFGLPMTLTLTVPPPVSSNGNAIGYGTTTFPAIAAPGAVIYFTYNVSNTGTRAWGADHHLSLRASGGSYLTFPSLNGVATGGGKIVGFTFTAPVTPGTYTFQVEALQDGVEVFGLLMTLSLTVQ